MYVGVLHTVKDRVRWSEVLGAFDRSSLPEGFANPVTFIGADSDYVFCLWEAPPVESLRELLDGIVADAATNLYFAVDPQGFGTIGFPAPAKLLVAAR